MVFGIYKKWLLRRLKRQGLQISDDCRLLASPKSCFGTEPYLISIGRHVTITSKVQFITHDGGTYVFRFSPEFQDVIKYGRITVHDNCFLGFGAIILPGVNIGPNSVVAAGSVVSKHIPPGQVWGGAPAKYICTTEEYSRESLRKTPDYNRRAYRKDKKTELLRHYPYPW
jgi:acetyltransferase-like isoleucine patch superfamily enzyme